MNMPIIFFDIGDTLASPIFSEDGRLKGFNVFPEAREALEALAAEGYEIGIISNPGSESAESVNQALRDCQLFGFFNPTSIVYKKKDSSRAFIDAAIQASVKPDQCVFVGENSRERAFALEAGFLRVVPHPSLVMDVIDGIALVYIRLKVKNDPAKWSEISGTLEIVPLKVTGGQMKIIYAIASVRSLDILRNLNFEVEVLGRRDSPLVTDLYLVRDDRAVPDNFAGPENYSADFLTTEGHGQLVVARSNEGLYLAIPAGESIESIHFPGALHGHNEKLLADMSLLSSTATVGVDTTDRDALAADTASLLGEEEFHFSDQENIELQKIDATRIRQYHEAYAGLAPIRDDYRLVSRHIRHADNQLAVDALQGHLLSIGGPGVQVGKHRFQHEEIFLDNVIAEYPGTEPESLVLVAAHLDSTASSTGGPYNPAIDPAPGADDDASGVAAVLAIAETISSLYAVNKPKRTIRFVLFNAEEHGLIGSKAYARSQAAISASIAAVFQIDMIGYRGNQTSTTRRFEVHAGFAASSSVESRSLQLAEIIRKVSAAVSPNIQSQQIYPEHENGNGTDPASGRSDHAPFQERGYAAVVVTEDFFAGPRFDSPAAQPNPNYHRRTDLQIDYEYAADIARIVAGAVLVSANA